MAGETKGSAENGSQSTISKLNPIRYASSAVGVIKSTFGSSATQVADGDNKASAENSSESTISKYNPIKHAGTAVGAIKGAFGSSGTPVGDGKSKGSAENGPESIISKYNPIKHAGTAVGAIKSVVGYFGTPGGIKENGSAENGSESTISKYNPIKHAGTAVGAIKDAFGSSGTPVGDGKSKGSAENGSESTISKYNPIKHAGTAIGAIKGAFGYFATAGGVEESNGSAEDGTESTISKFNPVGNAGSAVSAIKSIFGSFGAQVGDGESNSSAENGSESTRSKSSPLKYAGSAVGAIRNSFGYFGAPVGERESKTLATNPVDGIEAYSDPPSAVGESNASNSSRSHSNIFTNPKSAIYGWESAAGTDRDLTCSTESLGSDSSNEVQMTSSSGVSITLQTGSRSPVLNTIARAMIVSALGSSGRWTRDARFSSPVAPAFHFGHPSFSENSLKDFNGGFSTFEVSISGAFFKAYFTAKEGLFPGIKEMQNQETQTEEHITSQHYDVSAIWRMLECPVCFEIILSPIYQCKGGHNACYSCWSKVRKCPLCRSSRTKKRNYFAESLIEEIPLPCKYHAEGCFETVQFNSKRGHEEICTFRIIYQCPIDPLCNRIYGYKNMCIHLKDHHMNVCNFDDLVEESESFCIPVFKESQNIVHAFHIKQWGLFFLQKVFVGDLIGWFMQVIPATTNQSNFNYSLDVCDHNETRKEYFKGCVLPVGKPTDEIINTGKYLILSDLILKTIKVESPIMIVVRIWQNV